VNQSGEKPQSELEPLSPTWQAASRLSPNSVRQAECPIITDHELVCRIGRGSYGEVWLARNVIGAYRVWEAKWEKPNVGGGLQGAEMIGLRLSAFS
jgi:hypothetical protein